MRTLEQIIEDQMTLLPPQIRDAVASGKWRNAVYEIGKRHHLHVDQLGQLEEETRLVMIGIIPSREFEETLIDNLSLSKAEAQAIIGELNTEVFQHLKDFLMDMDGLEEKIARQRLGVEAQDDAPIDIPSREDLLKEIEDEHDMGKPPVVISPIAQKLSTPSVSAPVTSVTTVAAPIAPKPAPAPAPVAARPAPAPLSQVIPKPAPSPAAMQGMNMNSVPVIRPNVPEEAKPQAPIAPTPAPEAPTAPAAAPAAPKSSSDPYREQI